MTQDIAPTPQTDFEFPDGDFIDCKDAVKLCRKLERERNALQAAIDAAGAELGETYWIPIEDGTHPMVDREAAALAIAKLTQEIARLQQSVFKQADHAEIQFKRAEAAKRENVAMLYVNKELREQLAAEREKVLELSEDAARLDWLHHHLFSHSWNAVIGSGARTSWTLAGDWRHTVAKMVTDDIAVDFRKAIDAARGGPK